MIMAMVEMIHLLRQWVDEKAASIRRLLRFLIGERAEKPEKAIQDRRTRSSASTENNDKNKPKGHGRTPAAEYTGSTKVDIPHTSLQHKSRRPEC